MSTSVTSAANSNFTYPRRSIRLCGAPRTSAPRRPTATTTRGRIYQETKTFIGSFEELRDASLSGSRVQPKTGKAFIPGTLKAYTTAINHLKEFEQSRRRKLSFDDLTVEFQADFTEFLIKHHHLTANSLGKDIKNIKMVMNGAWERGLHKDLQHKSRRFTVSREHVDSIYLSSRLDELTYETAGYMDKAAFESKILLGNGC